MQLSSTIQSFFKGNTYSDQILQQIIMQMLLFIAMLWFAIAVLLSWSITAMYLLAIIVVGVVYVAFISQWPSIELPLTLNKHVILKNSGSHNNNNQFMFDFDVEGII